MKIYRLHKYDPSLFDEYRGYMKDEWTHISDVGKTFDGDVLTSEEYLRTESAYIGAIQIVCDHLEIDGLQIFSDNYKIEDVDNYETYLFGINPEDIPNIERGCWLSGKDIGQYCRLCLRDLQGFALSNRKNFFVCFTGDYYVHIGCDGVPETIIKQIQDLGLYLEYHGDFGAKDVDSEYYEQMLPDIAL